MSDSFFLTGTPVPEPEAVRLEAGRLAAELVNGNLRTISWDGVEVLRAVSYLVRDRDWGTYQPALHDLAVESGSEGFRVSFRGSIQGSGGNPLGLHARIEGSAAGTLVFDVTVTPDGDFETSRCGFCILHPIVGVAGGPVTVEHTDGKVIETAFPDLIEPWQPFKDMRSITHAVAPGVAAECRMEGDTAGMDGWEMEDQRNWTDASFKTYVRPLALPWPYLLPAGRPVRQAVRLSIRSAAADAPRLRPDTSAISPRLGGEGPPLPAIGVVIYPGDAVAGPATAALLEDLGPQGLLFHFDPTAGHGLEALRGFAEVARAYPAETTLECVVAAEGGSRADVEGELRQTAALVREAGLRLDSVAVSPSVDRQSTPPGSRWPDCPPLEAVYAAARRAFPDQKIGGGMFSYFTELNRKRVPADAIDFVTHCTNPIVHAADDLSVMQTLEALPFVTRSVRAIYGEKPYRIGPSTIPMRQNPYGSATKENPNGGRIPMANRDPRHNDLFGAAWAVGYAARVAPSGLDQLTLSGVAGPFGLLAGSGEPAKEGGVRPLFHAVKALAGMAGLAGVQVVAEDGDKVACLAARTADGKLRMLCANLTPGQVELELSAIPMGTDTVLEILDAEAIANGRPTRVQPPPGQATLGPYASLLIRPA